MFICCHNASAAFCSAQAGKEQTGWVGQVYAGQVAQLYAARGTPSDAAVHLRHMLPCAFLLGPFFRPFFFLAVREEQHGFA